MKILMMIKFDGSFLNTKWGNFPEKISKTLAKQLREELQMLENKVWKTKFYEQNLECFQNEDHLRCKVRLVEI